MGQTIGTRIKNALKGSIPGAGRLKVPKTWRKTYGDAIGTLQRQDGEGYALVGFNGKAGFDYQTYREIQEEGNKAKLHGQWVTRQHIETLCRFIEEAGVRVERGVCHGTRQGYEQKWFAECLTGRAEVFGTEISSTATQFPNTVQWDFHDENPDWAGRFDLVYSNSWDHAYDPEKAFSAWLGTLRPGGVLLLDHSRYHLPDRANELDPFGAKLEALKALIARLGGENGEIIGIVENRLHDETTTAPVDLPVATLVYRKTA